MSTGAVTRAIAATAPKNGATRPAWVIWCSTGLLALSAGVLCCAVVVGAYNIRYSYYRIGEITQSGPDGAAPPAVASESMAPEWVRPFLQDLSVVSPSLVAFTAACMVVAAAALAWFPVSAGRMTSVHFPFPASYKTYYVQLGLLGTIVGFVIAFSDVDPRAERQALVLIDALGTALWSTLTAILLAYGVCPVVEVVYQRLRQPTMLVPTDTRSALELLRQRTVDAAQSLGALTESASALSVELSVQQLQSRIAGLEETLGALGAQVDALQRTARDLTDYRREIEDGARATEAWAAATEEKLSQLDGQLSDVTRSVTAIAATADDLKLSAARLQEEDIPTQAERVDVLERRLDTIVKMLKNALE